MPGIQSPGIKNHCDFSLKTLQKQSATDGTPWQCSPDEAVLFTHANRGIVETNRILATA